MNKLAEIEMGVVGLIPDDDPLHQGFKLRYGPCSLRYLPADLRRQPFIRQPGIEIQPFQHTELTAVIKVPDPFEEHAFEELVDFYQTSLLRMCYLNLHDLGLAEDAVQETFVKAYRAMPSFRGDSDIKTWLMRIAINTCRDMQRGTWQKHLNQRVSFDQLPESSIAFPEDTFPLRISAPNNQKDLHRIRAWYMLMGHTVCFPAEKPAQSAPVYADHARQLSLGDIPVLTQINQPVSGIVA